ncbi:hypothetical protein [Roseibium limicola]|uniref:Uncharacterized protein n=1 Tax=Roseibium limicola TaxID=2816037 RepID=A0A939EU26_9HYPH|nr:hypothetical protein [Roseibium limicola]MBO0347104.1 hypothetical protein [Roseibium limicola]
MPPIGETSAAYGAANVRSELATNAIRDNNQQERQVANRLQEQQETTQGQDRRQARQIPGLGNAVDITA